MFENSMVVVAHPDDEVLWLSSILTRAGGIVFCFQDCPGAPKLGPGRRRVVAEYPLANCVNLGIEESASFNQANWDDPVETPYGLYIAKDSRVKERYQETYDELLKRLAPILRDCDNVFTHNPWGEYGHEDHIQVYRAVKTLRRELGYRLWFSNYCGQRSVKLMMSHIPGFSSDYITLPTNQELAHGLRDLYIKYGCWTWYRDYQWYKEESLMSDDVLDGPASSAGHIFPLNMLKTDFNPDRASKGTFSALLRKILRASN